MEPTKHTPSSINTSLKPQSNIPSGPSPKASSPKLKHPLKQDGNSPSSERSSQTLEGRSIKTEEIKTHFWQKQESYGLPDQVSEFIKHYNSLCSVVDKGGISSLPLIECCLDKSLHQLSKHLKSLTPTLPLSPELARHYNISPKLLSPHRGIPMSELLNHLEGASQAYLAEANDSEVAFKNLNLEQALSDIASFHSSYATYQDLQKTLEPLYHQLEQLENKAFEMDMQAYQTFVESNPQYLELNKTINELETNSKDLLENLKSGIPNYEKTGTALDCHYKRLIESKALGSYLRERKAYIQEHKQTFQLLVDNFFDCSKHPYTRYKDNLNKAWLDLMPSEYYCETGNADGLKQTDLEAYTSHIRILPKDEHYSRLAQKLEAYHALPKTDESKLEDRQRALKAIAQTAASCIKEAPNKLPKVELNILQEIIARTNLKADYLKQLMYLEEEALARLSNTPKNKTLPPSLGLIKVLTQHLHDLDPEKRYGLEDLHATWKDERTKDPKLSNFWLWLEGQNTADLSKDLRHTFINKSLKHIHFKNGLAYNEMFRSFKPGSKGLVADGQYVYNIGQDGDLYILPVFDTLSQFKKDSKVLFKNPLYSETELDTLKKELNHDTILGGGNILCAGLVKFKDGKIVHIDTNSGHYKPDMDPHLRSSLAYLLEKHPGSIDDSTQISDYHGTINLKYSEFKDPEKANSILTPPPHPTKKVILSMEDFGFTSKGQS